MKSPTLILLIALVLVCSGCMRQRESKFFHAFSMKQLATEDRSYSLSCEGGGGGNSVFSKAFLFAGSTDYHASRSDSSICKVNSGQTLDESELVVSLARDMENRVKSSGLSIVDTGQKDPRSSFVDYADENCKGRIEVSLTSVDSGRIALHALLVESGH